MAKRYVMASTDSKVESSQSIKVAADVDVGIEEGEWDTVGAMGAEVMGATGAEVIGAFVTGVAVTGAAVTGAELTGAAVAGGVV